MNFLAPLAFLGGLIAVPILLLYMLRLRRREVPISSTYLWRQVIQDNEANTPWQRLRRNLLLILQLIILALMVLALARPFIIVDAVSAGQVTLLLDASASMNTQEGERSRFDIAQDAALDIVDTLSAGDNMTVIRVGAVPEVLASASSDRAALRRAINDAAPSLAEADWSAALTLAAASGAATEDFNIVIIGDGGLPSDVTLPGISGAVTYLPVGTETNNVALTALATDALPGQPTQLYAEVTNYGADEALVSVNLTVDGDFFDTINLSVPAGGVQPIVTDALPEGFRTVQADLVRRGTPDPLLADNTAFAVNGSADTRRVLIVTQGNRFLEQVVRSQPGIDAVRTDGTSGIPDGFDVVILDEVVPSTLPEGDLMFINPQASGPFFQIGAYTEDTARPRVTDPSDPRVLYLPEVNIASANFLRIRQVSAVDWADVLVEVDGGPVLLAGEVDGRQVALLPFNVRESDLPLLLAWPVMIFDLLEWFTPTTVLAEQDRYAVGDAMALLPPPTADVLRVTPPDGEAVTLQVDRRTLIYADTGTPGLYDVVALEDGETAAAQMLAVNLFSPLESVIAPVPADALSIPGVAVNAATREEEGQRELWPWVVLGALLVLMIEWVAHHRRLRVPTVFRPLTPAASRS